MRKAIQCVLVLFTFIVHLPLKAQEVLPTNKKVFLTGAAGFIGSNFLQYMFDKYPEYQFVVLDALTYAGTLNNIPSYIQESDRFQFVKGSILDERLVDSLMENCDFVVHFAAETHVTRSIINDYDFFSTDVLGTRSLMQGLVHHADSIERFVHISTSEVYGTAEYVPMDELHPLNPRSPYAAAKTGADRLVYAYACTYDIPVMIIRPFNNYGPRQHVEKMVPHFITNALLGLPITIHGNGLQKRDWIYVEDACVGIDKVLHVEDFSRVKNQVINLGSEHGISVLEIAQLILRELNLPENFLVFIEDRPGQVECHFGSIQKAYELLGWKPTVNFSEGIKKTIQWYRENQPLWEDSKADALTSVPQHK